MKSIRHVLIAVKNPDGRTQPGVEKALRIAKQLGASVELFHAISHAVFLELEPLNGRTVPEIRRQALQLREARLDRLASRAHKLGVKATCHVAWDYPPHEAIVRRAGQVHADLIVAECHEGRRLKPWLIHLTDWELLRLSTKPVLLLKNDREWREPLILAAVDPSHAHAKPGRLDDAIVAQAGALSRVMGGSFELVHANFPAGFALMMADPSMSTATLDAAYDSLKARSRKRFEAFAARARVPRARCHLIDTDPEFAIPHVARKLGVDLVVMGALSRSGLKRVFIGNTAERVLESLPCDVLVVKPPHFPRRVASKPRGMRLVPPQPIMPLPV